MNGSRTFSHLLDILLFSDEAPATWNCFHVECRFLRLKATPTRSNTMNLLEYQWTDQERFPISWTFFSSVMRRICTWAGMLIKSKTWGSMPQHSPMSMCNASARGGILLLEIASGQEWLILLQSSRILVHSWTENCFWFWCKVQGF